MKNRDIKNVIDEILNVIPVNEKTNRLISDLKYYKSRYSLTPPEGGIYIFESLWEKLCYKLPTYEISEEWEYKVWSIFTTRPISEVKALCKEEIGIPGSGKTTFTKEFIKNNPNYVRINRDDFRVMLLDQTVCEPKIENLITEMSDACILKALRKKQNVILDNTHVQERYINEIIHKFKSFADIEFMIFDVPASKCIERDALRPKPVGEKVINKMDKDFKILKDTFVFQPVKKSEKQRHLSLIAQDTNLPKCVIIDFDNTLAFIGKRSPFDWKKVGCDYPNQVVIDHARLYKEAGFTIIILSGRDGVCQGESEEWLKFYGVPYDHFFMRKPNDFRKDSIVKKEIYENQIKGKYNVFVSLDDRQQVVDTWRELGLSCFQVNESVD